ncbi:hypothetical protein OG893_19375 [Streptomyces sp. NBC_01696]|uniref:hypothetical protein n=1 Tax=unclassified Streptomyces TaxID=2593676 RepID=UPI0029BCA69B|nr:MULTISPECIES: hypothetical protein [unclassified Streptomyces]MDX3433861.1 hypothetical protein [Streptomyces sp. ME01-18a]
MELDQGATAARILGAAGAWRVDSPRSAAEESQVTAATARLHTALGPGGTRRRAHWASA